MTTNRKGRAGWHQATLRTSIHTSNCTDLAACIKAAIVTMTLWGLLPVAMADLLINLGGLRDV